MTRARLITVLVLVLVLLAAVTVSPAGASDASGTGFIPLQLTDAETSYLGVLLDSPTHRGRNARLPITNNRSNLSTWSSSISLEVLETRLVGTSIAARVVPHVYNLIGTEPWIDEYESFTYYVELAKVKASQPQSSLYFAYGPQGEPLFAGTLYVTALLHKIDLETGADSTQLLDLALNVDGKWVDEPAVNDLDADLSSLLPFTERDALGRPTDRYVCVNETHPDGYYCLQISPTLLLALGGR